MSLVVRGLRVGYGGPDVVDGVSLEVPAGGLVGLVGPNGAGKTSLLDAVSGFADYRGHVWLNGQKLDALSADARARGGLRRTWQTLDLFEDLTVGENLAVGALPSEGEASNRTAALGLDVDAGQLPATLSHGDRSMLSLGRALAGRPSVLLLDEPAAGLDQTERGQLANRLRRLAARGVGVLLVEHDLSLVVAVCNTVLVLAEGRLIAQGAPTEVVANPAVRSAYLGVDLPPIAPTMSRPAISADGTRRPLLQVRGLSAGYAGAPVLSDVHLSLARGEVLALLGGNGSGKTTLLRVICGLHPPTAGEILIDGRRLPRRPEARARKGVAFVPADHQLFGSLTVHENLLLARRRPHADVLDRLPALRPLLGRRAALLSGGEAKQLAIARAMLRRPRILLIDEPLSGLAPPIADQLLAALRHLVDQDGMSVLLVAQAAERVLAVADRAAVCNSGRVVLEGPAAELAQRRNLVDAAHLVPPTAQGCDVSSE